MALKDFGKINEMWGGWKMRKKSHTEPMKNQGHGIVLQDIKNSARAFQGEFEENLIIGREVGACGLVIQGDHSVSHRHCEISAKQGKFYIRDLTSANGTYLNSETARIQTETEIKSGAMLKIGVSWFQVRIW